MSALTAGSSVGLRKSFRQQRFLRSTVAPSDRLHVRRNRARHSGARHREPLRDHSLRFSIGGGTTAELARTTEDRFGFKVHELYGMTEVGGWVSGSTARDHKLGTNGRVRPDVQVQIVDPADNPLPVGERGEIVVRPREPNRILMGYYNKPDELAKASRNFWFHTGDVGSFDSDGYLYFHGRTKELIRRGGEMISPQELEERLLKLPGIRDARSSALPIRSWARKSRLSSLRMAISICGICAVGSPIRCRPTCCRGSQSASPRSRAPRRKKFCAANCNTSTIGSSISQNHKGRDSK